MKKVLVIGATGTIGEAICHELSRDCQVIKIGRTSGDSTVEIESSESIIALYKKYNDIDAIICAAARNVIFKPLIDMTKDMYITSMQSKQMGQIDLVIQGLKLLPSHVSFTLTTGLLNCDPIVTGSAAAMVNGAIEGFVRASAIDMPEKQRINAVSPNLLLESLDKYRDFFPGYIPVPAATVALAYRKCVMGNQTGQIVKVGW